MGFGYEINVNDIQIHVNERFYTNEYNIQTYMYTYLHILGLNDIAHLSKNQSHLWLEQ
jgi:hypothetical protein